VLVAADAVRITVMASAAGLGAERLFGLVRGLRSHALWSSRAGETAQAQALRLSWSSLGGRERPWWQAWP